MTGYQSKKAAAQAIDKVNWADHEPDGLAQPAQQEPCDMGDICIGCSPRNADGSCPSAQPAQQEPVAWAHKEGLESIKDFDASIYATGGFDDAVPLYTTPPQPEERNFCPRCGKRTKDIHTCTPPQEKNA